MAFIYMVCGVDKIGCVAFKIQKNRNVKKYQVILREVKKVTTTRLIKCPATNFEKRQAWMTLLVVFCFVLF